MLKLFTCALIITTLSMFATVFCLRLHHTIGDESNKMPDWVKIFCKYKSKTFIQLRWIFIDSDLTKVVGLSYVRKAAAPDILEKLVDENLQPLTLKSIKGSGIIETLDFLKIICRYPLQQSLINQKNIEAIFQAKTTTKTKQKLFVRT